MVLLASDKRVRVMDGGPYVLDRDTILALHLVEAHSANQTPKNDRNRQPRPSDDGPAVTNSWINLNPVVRVRHSEPDYRLRAAMW